jgi:hypothetical protein
MTETLEGVYQFTFYHPYDICQDGWAECDGERIYHRLGLEFGVAVLSRALKALGKPDGDIVATEVQSKNPLIQYFESMHRLASCLPVNIMFSTPVYKSLALLAENPDDWSKIENKNDLLARDLVIDGILTDAGKTALEEYSKGRQKENNAVLTTGQKEALALMLDNGKWDDVHGKTQNVLIASGWVEMTGKVASLTPSGQEAYQKAISAPKIEITDTEPSEAAIKALVALRDNPNVWGKTGTRMKGDLKARDFVSVESTIYANITSLGLQAITKGQST